MGFVAISYAFQPCTNFENRLRQNTDSIKVGTFLRYSVGHFEDVLPSQFLGLLLKKLDLTQEKQTTQESNGKNLQKNKARPKR